MQCSLTEPSVEPLDNLHVLVCQAVEEVERETADPTTAGILGNRFSTRYRLVDLLDHYYKQDTNIFFGEED